jgi:hypothetical protein
MRLRFPPVVIAIAIVVTLLTGGFIYAVIDAQAKADADDQLREAAASAAAYGAAHDDTWAPGRDTLIEWVADQQVKPSWHPGLASAAELAEVDYVVTPDRGATITVRVDSVFGDVTRTWSSVDGS